MDNKLNLDRATIDGARATASRIADQLHGWINLYTTTTIERAVARLLGVDGVDAAGVPLPNVLVDRLHEKGLLGHGLLSWLARAMLSTGRNAQEIAEAVAEGNWMWPQYPCCLKRNGANWAIAWRQRRRQRLPPAGASGSR